MMAYLKAGYSPEQIAGTLAAVHPQTSSLRVSHETIYTAIYAMPHGELRMNGWLRFAHAKRRPVHVERIVAGTSPTWSASMTDRRRLMNA
jgi:IS30 family transposase